MDWETKEELGMIPGIFFIFLLIDFVILKNVGGIEINFFTFLGLPILATLIFTLIFIFIRKHFSKGEAIKCIVIGFILINVGAFTISFHGQLPVGYTSIAFGIASLVYGLIKLKEK
jgi:hypothetical protein